MRARFTKWGFPGQFYTTCHRNIGLNEVDCRETKLNGSQIATFKLYKCTFVLKYFNNNDNNKDKTYTAQKQKQKGSASTQGAVKEQLLQQKSGPDKINFIQNVLPFFCYA